MLKDDGYVLLNNLELAVGGPWTRMDRIDNSILSFLDLARLIPIVLRSITSLMSVQTREE